MALTTEEVMRRTLALAQHQLGNYKRATGTKPGSNGAPAELSSEEECAHPEMGRLMEIDCDPPLPAIVSQKNRMFVFDPATQGPPEMNDTWMFGPTDAGAVQKMRRLYPELAHWPDAHLVAAWGNYSQDVLAVGFGDVQDRDTGLLAYLYVRQEAPDFTFLGTGLFDSDIWDLADSEPWLSGAPLPSPFRRNPS